MAITIVTLNPASAVIIKELAKYLSGAQTYGSAVLQCKNTLLWAQALEGEIRPWTKEGAPAARALGMFTISQDGTEVPHAPGIQTDYVGHFSRALGGTAGVNAFKMVILKAIMKDAALDDVIVTPADFTKALHEISRIVRMDNNIVFNQDGTPDYSLSKPGRVAKPVVADASELRARLEALSAQQAQRDQQIAQMMEMNKLLMEQLEAAKAAA